MAAKEPVKQVTANRKAFHEYEVLERFEAGIRLSGTEVKSIRAGQVNLTGSYAQVEGGQLILREAHISPYEHGNRFNHTPVRPRRLLMHRREILRLQEQTGQKGYTLVPLSLYLKHGLIKVELGLCRGKVLHDKREAIRSKTMDREAERAIRARSR
jgi:SsrA-binding protein